MQVVDTKFVVHLKHQYWAPLSWGSMKFSAFLVFSVWTSLTTYLTFGEGELHNANHFLSLYSYFSPCCLISRYSWFLSRWFTTVDALSLLTCRYDKIKNLKSKACYYDEPYRKFVVVKKKKTKNGYDEELLHWKPLQSWRSAHVYMEGYWKNK